MMVSTDSSYRNPFVECTARDIEPIDVCKYWCSPFEYYALDEHQLFTSHTSLIIEGNRGSGKTMILKYLSYFCQKMIAQENNKDVIAQIIEKGGIGFYYRYNSDFDDRVSGLDCSQEVKNDVFSYYYEMYLSDSILETLEDIEKNSYIDASEVANLREQVSSMFELDGVVTFTDIRKEVELRVKELDHWFKLRRYMDNAYEGLRDLIRGKEYVRSICFAIKRTITSFQDVELLVIIDEYENVKNFQTITNTWLRKSDDRFYYSFRIGMRPQGMVTLDTEYQEELKGERDFILIPLVCISHEKYKKFLKKVARIRLEKVPFFRDANLTDITKLLGAREKFDEEASRVVKDNSDVIFARLGVKEEYVKGCLRNREKPLVQMLNVLWYLRSTRLTRSKQPQISPEDIRDASIAYLEGKADKNSDDRIFRLAYKYKLDYSSKYRLHLLIELCSLFRVNKAYYSFNTFSYLSGTIVNDFISLCRNTFKQIDTNVDLADLEKGKIIDINKQTEGAEITANSDLDQLMRIGSGNKMYSFVMALGDEFKKKHKDKLAKYPETNQFAFENEAEVDADTELLALKNGMLNEGTIQKRLKRQRISLGKEKEGNIYTLKKLYMPIFSLSYRTRGGYNLVLSTKDFRTIVGVGLRV